MPDSPSPFDDPFADLFGKLPDPRARERRSADDEESADGGSATPVPSTPHTPPAAGPQSRRAAREAASVGDEPRRAESAGADQRSATPSDESAPAFAPVPAPTPAYEPVPAPVSTMGGDPGPVRTSARPAATGTLDDLFTGKQSTDSLGDVPPPTNKRKRRIGGWIALGVVLVLLGGIAGGGLWVWNTYEEKIREFMGWEEPQDFEPGSANGEVLVTIETGDTGAPISQRLYDSGVTRTPDAFYDYLIDTGQNPSFQPGAYSLQYEMTSEAALDALMDPTKKRENTAQIPEGFTVDGTVERLAEGTGLPIEEFQAAVADPSAYGVASSSLEGWLFPATYTFDPGVTPVQMIQTMVDRTVQSLDTAGVPVDDRQRVLTVASIIQREARFETDFYKVSRVIENRLDADNQETFGKLQMDSTAQYGYGEMHDGTVSTSQEALDDPNPWNTYYNTGLPVGPIANPGDLAIDAAMHPADGDWLYFVTVNLNTGETVFTTNIDDHNAAVAQWQAWCTENPDAGC